jgi:hypothetical protein
MKSSNVQSRFLFRLVLNLCFQYFIRKLVIGASKCVALRSFRLDARWFRAAQSLHFAYISKYTAVHLAVYTAVYTGVYTALFRELHTLKKNAEKCLVISNLLFTYYKPCAWRHTLCVQGKKPVVSVVLRTKRLQLCSTRHGNDWSLGVWVPVPHKVLSVLSALFRFMHL